MPRNDLDRKYDHLDRANQLESGEMIIWIEFMYQLQCYFQ